MSLTILFGFFLPEMIWVCVQCKFGHPIMHVNLGMRPICVLRPKCMFDTNLLIILYIMLSRANNFDISTLRNNEKCV